MTVSQTCAAVPPTRLCAWTLVLTCAGNIEPRVESWKFEPQHITMKSKAETTPTDHQKNKDNVGTICTWGNILGFILSHFLQILFKSPYVCFFLKESESWVWKLTEVLPILSVHAGAGLSGGRRGLHRPGQVVLRHRDVIA